MKSHKFLSFLITVLAVAVFLAGYIMVGYETDNKTQSETGTILDKFGKLESEGAEQETNQNLPFLSRI